MKKLNLRFPFKWIYIYIFFLKLAYMINVNVIFIVHGRSSDCVHAYNCWKSPECGCQLSHEHELNCCKRLEQCQHVGK